MKEIEMKKKSIEREVARRLTGETPPSLKNLKTAVDRFNEATTSAPVDEFPHLFDGIQFRNGGRTEALRRVRNMICIIRDQERIKAQERNKLANGHVADALTERNEHIIRLQNTIRHMKRNHAEEIIAIAETPMVGEQFQAEANRA